MSDDLTSEIENWNVSLVDDMSYLFQRKHTCNPSIGSWDVSSVTNFVSHEVIAFFNNRFFELYNNRSLDVKSF